MGVYLCVIIEMEMTVLYFFFSEKNLNLSVAPYLEERFDLQGQSYKQYFLCKFSHII